ncbi:MAG: Holliday junction branch migration protein RuvA [Lachnospiraceae bacterium]|nr:Holliday junction branch migration protein RuvA [Lachnospiraceae bacterium]
MISYLRGVLAERTQEGIVVEVNGVGFFVRVPVLTAEKLPPLGQEVKIYTYLHVKEDLMQLYGFLRRDDLNMFESMLKVNGIGPKGAIAILSGMNADDLRFAILSGDAKTIAKRAAGVGLKTAQKMILELKDKMDLEETFEMAMEHSAQDGNGMGAADNAKSEAVLALTALGYNQTQALKAVSAVEHGEQMSVEDLLKAALKHM